MTKTKNAITLGSLRIGQTHQRLGARRIICNVRFSKINKVIPERVLYLDQDENFRSVTAQTFVKWSMGVELVDVLQMPSDESLKQHVNGGITPVRSDRRKKKPPKKNSFEPLPKMNSVVPRPERTSDKMKDNKTLLAFAAKKMGGLEGLKREFTISRIEELNGADLTIEQVLDIATDEDWYDYLVKFKFSDLVSKIGKLTPGVIQQRIVDCIVSTERSVRFISDITGIKINTVRVTIKKLVRNGKVKMTGKGMNVKYVIK